MYNAKASSAASEKSSLASSSIKRRATTENDVQMEILFCGICHSDLHQVRNEWESAMPTVYPCVPGHEIVGRVTKVGSAVKNFKSGDLAAVGCMVDSDRTCKECQAGLEQFCRHFTLTYNFPDKHLGGVTYGGYSDSIVVDQRFVLRVPANLDHAGAAPLLCRNHNLLARAPLGCHQGQESWRGRSRRTGSHGREICPCARNPGCRLHDFPQKEARRTPPRSRRSRHLAERGRDAKARWQLRLHSRRCLRRSRDKRLHPSAAP